MKGGYIIRNQRNIISTMLLFLLFFCSQNQPITGSGTKSHCCITEYMVNVTSVDCESCGLRAIPNNLPPITTNLNLAHNDLEVVMKNEFQNLENIEVLILSNCKLKFISVKAFSNLYSLKKLDLSNNRLTTFKEVTFENLHNLYELRIDSNKYYERRFNPLEALYNVTSVRVLTLDMFDNHPLGQNPVPMHQNLEEVGLFVPGTLTQVIELKRSTFANSQNLKYINVTGNVYGIEHNTFEPLKNLSGLSITHTKYMSIAVVLASLSQITDRQIDYLIINEVTSIAKMRSFTLDEMNIRFLSSNCIRHLSLVSSNIGSFTFGAIRSLQRSFQCVESFDLSGNPELRYNDLTAVVSLMQNLRHLDLCCIKKARSKRSVSDHAASTNVRVFQIPRRLEYLNVSYNDFQFTPMYSIQALNGKNLHVLDASYLNLSSCNGYIRGLSSLRIFNMSGWNCSSLSPYLIMEMSNLTRFEARNSRLGSGLKFDTKGQFFKGLDRLEYIDLSYNRLENIHQNLLHDQTRSLKYLVLRHNCLKTIPSTLHNLAMLESLDLRGNLLNGLDDESRNTLDSISSTNVNLNLAGNKFLCTCPHVESFRWIKDNKIHIRDIDILKCTDLTGVEFNVTEILSDFEHFESDCKPRLLIYWVVGICAVLLCVVAMVILGYRYRVSFHYWSATRKRRQHNQYLTEVDQDYDAYVAYSGADEDWVLGPFWNYMGQGHEGNIFLSNRDLPQGRDIARNVISAAEKSKRIVLVITWDFLRTKWKTLEIQILMKHATRKQRSDRIIILLLEEIKIDAMPKAVRKAWWKFNCFSWPRDEQFNNSERLNAAREKFWEHTSKAIRRSVEEMSVHDISI